MWYSGAVAAMFLIQGGHWSTMRENYSSIWREAEARDGGLDWHVGVLWFQLFLRPISIFDLPSEKLFNFTTHLSRPDGEVETQIEWLQSVGGSFSASKRSPRVGHRWLLRKHQGPTLLLFGSSSLALASILMDTRWLLEFQLSFLLPGRRGTHPNWFSTSSPRISWKLHNDVYCSFFNHPQLQGKLGAIALFGHVITLNKSRFFIKQEGNTGCLVGN